MTPTFEGLTVAEAMIRDPKLCSPAVTVAEIHDLFQDSHVHAALITEGSRLICVIERSDVVRAARSDRGARPYGQLAGRTVTASTSLQSAFDRLRASGRRRIAVVDERGTLLGLLCLKASSSGFCSARDVQARVLERATSKPAS